MKDELVSVVITTYKREAAMVIRAVNSVVNQTYKNLEIIVVDDSPEEYVNRRDVKKSIEEYRDKRIKYIQHTKNMGACKARNTGLQNAQGKYIGFLDDDDEWLPEKVELQIGAFQEGVGMVYGDTILINDIKNKKKYMHMMDGKENMYHKLLKKNFIGSTSFPLLDRQKLVEIGGFDINMPALQDWDVWLRMAKENKIVYLPRPFVAYHVHEGERITKNPDKRLLALELLFDKHKEYVANHKEIQRAVLSNRKNFLIYGKRYKEAVKVYLEFLKIQPLCIIQNIKELKTFARILIPNKFI